MTGMIIAYAEWVTDNQPEIDRQGRGSLPCSLSQMGRGKRGHNMENNVHFVWFLADGDGFQSVGIPVETVNKVIDKYNAEPVNFNKHPEKGMLPQNFVPYLNWELFWETGTDYHMIHWDMTTSSNILKMLHTFNTGED